MYPSVNLSELGQDPGQTTDHIIPRCEKVLHQQSKGK